MISSAALWPTQKRAALLLRSGGVYLSLLGAAQTARHDSGMQLTQPEAVLLDELLAPAYAAVTPQDWNAWLAAGRALSQPEALALLRSLSPA